MARISEIHFAKLSKGNRKLEGKKMQFFSWTGRLSGQWTRHIHFTCLKVLLAEKSCMLCWFILLLSRFPLLTEFLSPVMSGYKQFSDQSSKPNKTIIFHNKKGLPKTNSNPNQKYKNFTLLLLPQNPSSCIQTGGHGGNAPFWHCFILSKVGCCLEISVRYKSHISLINWYNTILECWILLSFKLVKVFCP